MRGADWNEKEGYDLSRRQRLLLAAGVVSVVAVVGVAFVGAFVLGPGGPPWADDGTRALQASFGADVDPGSDGWGSGDETVTIVHEGGERVDPANLVLRVEGDDSSGDETAVGGVAWPGNRSDGGEDGSWSAGEAATYTGDVPANATLLLVWSAPGRDVKQVVDAWAVPPGQRAASNAVRGPGTVAVPFAALAPLEQRSYSRQSHASTAAASRSWAVSYDTVAGWPPACP